MDYDCIVVGAGPSGTTCAKFLAENSVNTLIIDKHEFPRHKTCAAGLLQHTFKDFDYVKPFIDVYNSEVEVHDADLLNKFTISSENPLVAMTKGRKHFDNELLTLAKNAGASFIGGSCVSNVIRKENKVEVLYGNGEKVSANVVVGADSLPSVVGKSLGFGLPHGNNIYGIALEKEYHLSEAVCDEYFGKGRRVSLFLHYADNEGYGWIFPRKSSVNIGLGGMANKGRIIGKLFDRFIDDLKLKKIIPNHDFQGNEINTTNKLAAILPATVPNKNILTDNALLVGDAGGFCSVATGEGIFYAMTSGKLAAETINKLFKEQQNPTFSKIDLMDYYSRFSSKILKELKFQYYAFDKVIRDPRRARKAVAWGNQDEKLREIFGSFLVGARSYDNLQYSMLYHYLRCKIKEKLGIIKLPDNVPY